ncbi:MAG: pre-16S rRNA-processing nuclease YqgF [Vulcanimicrobiaceae bacterium]|jgi:RNase H-fold protein (predicted Holliday junction resolvase)
MSVLGVDPGTRKCGYAVVASLDAAPLALGIASVETLAAVAGELVAAHGVTAIVVGRGTNAAVIAKAVEPLGLPIHFVDEYETTLRARARYFHDHPPRGWRRLIPRGMLLPDRPVDDYAALLIAERYLQAPQDGQESSARAR